MQLGPRETIMGWINLGHMPGKVAAGMGLKQRPEVDLDEVVSRL